MKLRITQDTQAGASYFYFIEGTTHSHTVEMPNGWNVDFDTDGNIRGIEVLDLLSTLLVQDITGTDIAMPDRLLTFNEGSTE